MIIGNGLLAKIFSHLYSDRSEITIFAAGVSNSTETEPAAFERERRLLIEQLDQTQTKLVYFGSCAVGNPLERFTPYLQHKAEMESLVVTSGKGMVFRLPQVVGRSANTHTLTNYLYHHIISGEHFTVWSRAERNLVDIEDILPIASFIIEREWETSQVVPIAGLRSTPMPVIVRTFEEVLGTKANFSLVDKGAPFPIDTSIAESVSRRLGINLGAGYLDRILHKYYASRPAL